MIRGVGETRAALLREHGCHTIGDLLARGPQQILPGTERRRGISHKTMEELVWRAQVFLDDTPVALTHPVEPLPEQYIALDLEYDDQEVMVWMATLRTASTGADERITVCADTFTQHKMATTIQEFLTRHPELPILTWGGTTADMPRLGFLFSDLQPVLARHLDAHRWLKQHWAMPLKSTGLKELARHYGIDDPSDGTITGFLAPHMWRNYLLNPTAHQDEFTALVEYNQWDVNTLVELCTAFRLLPNMPDQPITHTFAKDHLFNFTR